MLDIATISESVNNAAHEFPIKRVDLFGSYAEERQTEKSDVDLLIEFTSIAVSLLLLASLRGWRRILAHRSTSCMRPFPMALYWMWEKR